MYTHDMHTHTCTNMNTDTSPVCCVYIIILIGSPIACTSRSLQMLEVSGFRGLGVTLLFSSTLAPRNNPLVYCPQGIGPNHSRSGSLGSTVGREAGAAPIRQHGSCGPVKLSIASSMLSSPRPAIYCGAYS